MYNEKFKKDFCAYIEEHGLSQGSETSTVITACKFFDISKQTFYNYKNDNPDFVLAIKTAQEFFISKTCETLKKSLLSRAKGGTYTTTEQIYDIDSEGYKKLTREKKIIKEVPPDTGAAIYLLSKYDPENFSNDYIKGSNTSSNNIVKFEILKNITNAIENNNIVVQEEPSSVLDD